MKRLFFAIFSILFGISTFFITPNLAFGYVDLSVNYNFSQRKIEGASSGEELGEDAGMAVTTTEGWSLNWGWYIWEYTALELNYSRSKERLVDDRATSTEDDSITINKVDSLVVTEVQGAGIRQSFASRKSLIIPSLAIGYAKLITSGETSYELEDSTGTKESLTLERDKEVFNSAYATFQLRFRLTQLMGLTLAAKAVMPEFDTSKAGDNLTYSGGFSWVF